MAVPTATLPALPNELIVQVLGHLQGDVPSLQAAARTCSALKAPAELCLYASIQVTKRAPLGRLAHSIGQDSARQQYIRRLDFLFSTRDYDHDDVPLPDLRCLGGLSSLTSESPRCNAGSREPDWGHDWDIDMQTLLDVFDEASLLRQPSSSERPLENLQSLTLHWTSSFALDERFWHITPSCPVFFLPALRSLTISCAVITSTEADNHALNYAHQTRLETLALVESIISADALDILLALPRELKSLGLHEMSHHIRWIDTTSDESIFYNIDAFNRAVARQRQSLESLQITRQTPFRPRCTRKFSLGLLLSDFESLKHLQVGPFPKDAGRPWALVPPLPPALVNVRLTGFDITTLQPQGVNKVLLENMHLGELAANAMDREEQLQIDIILSPFRSYNYSEPRRPTVRGLIDDFIALFEHHQSSLSVGAGEKPGAEAREGLVAGETSGDVAEIPPAPNRRARVRFMTSKPVSYIPPYLHGEKRPRHVVRFDSAEAGSGPNTLPYLDENGAPEIELKPSELDQDMRAAFAWASS